MQAILSLGMVETAPLPDPFRLNLVSAEDRTAVQAETQIQDRRLRRVDVGRHSLWMAGIFGVIVIQLVVAARQIFRSTGTVFQQDSFMHLLTSRYVLHDWTYALGVWARPVVALTYVPVASSGLGALHVETFLMVVAIVAMTMAIAKQLGLRWWPAVGIFVLAQPFLIFVADGALPMIPFAFLLSLSILLRVKGFTWAPLLVASLIPLTRVEGIVVVGVWFVFEVMAGRWKRAPLLFTGSFLWWLVSTVEYRNPLYLLQNNTYLRAHDAFVIPTWHFAFGSMTLIAGGVVCGLAIASIAKRRFPDPLVPSILVAMLAFYWVTWTFGLFNTRPNSRYLVTLCVPMALMALHAVTDFTPQKPVAIWRDGVAVVVALLCSLYPVVWAVYPTQHLYLRLPVVITVGVLLAARLPIGAELRRWGSAIVLLGAAGLGIVLLHPVGIGNVEPLTAATLQRIEPTIARSVTTVDQGFAYLSGRDAPMLSFPRGVEHAPKGTYVLWESRWQHDGGADLSVADLEALGYTKVWSLTSQGQTAVLLRRVA